MKVLILGGSGVFGSRLARLLARDGHDLVLAARNRDRLRTLAAELKCASLTLDRDSDLAPILTVRPDVVVDAAGPFQNAGPSPYKLAHFCIANQIHYLDLSDDGAFTAGISTLDEAARKAGVFALSGASSVPAISAAASAALARAMTSIEAIDTAILPGNRTPRGHSLVAAILTQAGKPLRIWRGGWMETRAWTEKRVYEIAPSVKRSAWLIGAPDLSLFPAHFGAEAVTFRAGMELGLLNAAVSAFAWLHRRNLIAPSEGVVRLALAFSRLLEPFGSDCGGMVVSVRGRQEGGLVERVWRLIAQRGDGPFIPGIPVRALLRRPDRIGAGARPCLSELSLDELGEAMGDLKVATSITQNIPVFESVLGSDWSALPPNVRDLHSIFDARTFVGVAEVERGKGLGPMLLASLFGFPKAGRAIPVRVEIRPTPSGETWTRTFGRASFRSYLTKAQSGGVTERFGALSFDIALTARDGDLLYPVTRGRAFGVPMPRALLPVSETREYEEDGQFHFDVALKAPLGMGLMVRYKGRLAPAGEPEANAKIEVLYNGVCPVCRAGACDLERRAAAARAGVIFTDVAHNADALTRAGVTLDDVRLKLHALRPDGYVLRGMPAVALAWSATPPYQMLGRISRIPPFNWMAAAAYHVTAHVLWHWNRACGRW